MNFSYENCRNQTFLEDSSKFDTVVAKWSTLSSVLFLPSILTAFTGVVIADMYGNFQLLAAGFISDILGFGFTFLTFIWKRYELILFGRVLNGVSKGIYSIVVPLLIKKFASEENLSIFEASWQVTFNFAAILFNFLGLDWVLGTAEHWFWLPGIAVGFSIIGLATSIFMACYFTAETTPRTETKMIESLRALAKDKKELTLAVKLSIIGNAEQWVGALIFITYGTEIIESLGVSRNVAIYIYLIFQAVALLTSMTLLPWFLRISSKRNILCLCMFVMMINCILIPVLGQFDGLAIKIFSVINICCFLFGNNFGTGPLPYVIATDYVSSEFRMVTQSIVIFSMGLLSALFNFIFPPLQVYLKSYSFLIFAVMTGVFLLWMKLSFKTKKIKIGNLSKYKIGNIEN